jgi:hypothetical protein
MEHGGRVHHDGHFFDQLYPSISLSGIQVQCKRFVIGEKSAATANAADFVPCENFLHRRACRDSVRLLPARGETFVVPRFTSEFHNPYFFSDVMVFQTYYRAPSACP